MNINKLFNDYLNSGYSNLSAISKTCQDVILLKISNSSLNKNVTIKDIAGNEEHYQDLPRCKGFG